MRVLGEDLIEMGSTEFDGGEAVGEVAAGDANDGAGEQALCSGCGNCAQGASVYRLGSEEQTSARSEKN